MKKHSLSLKKLAKLTTFVSMTFVLCLFFSTSVFATWVSTKGVLYRNFDRSYDAVKSNPSFHNSFENKIISNENFALKASIEAIDINVVNPLNVEQEGLLGTKFVEINLASKGNNAYTTQIGLPKLPVVKKWVEFSGNINDIKINLDNSDISKFQKFDLSNFADMVVPVLPSVVKLPGELEKAKFVINKDFYSTSQIYPLENYKIKDMISIRGKKLALLEIYPVRYNPATKELYINENFQVNFNLKKFKSNKETSYAFNKVLSRIVFNRVNANSNKDLNEDFVADFAAGTFKDTLFIVYGSKYAGSTALTDYIKLKRQMGYNVLSKNISEIGNTDQLLRTYVKNLYNNQNTRPSYMVIIVRMAVPCCRGLSQIAQEAREICDRKDLILEEHVISIEDGSVKEVNIL